MTADASPIVTVFGSSRAIRGDGDYLAAQRLGQLLAIRGWTVCNGGHEGTMEAASRGAKELGGATIGVSLSLYRPRKPNQFLDREIIAESLFSRLEQLVTLGDAFVALYGGIGTLLEVSLAWNLVQSPPFEGKPLIVVGPEWAAIFREYQQSLALRPAERARLTLVEGVEEAVGVLAAHFAERESPSAL